jgi:hypothetical protein
MAKKRKKNSELPLWQRKQQHKGIPCRRNQPIYYDELKERISLMLTPTALDKLKQMAQNQKCSRSEVIERWLRSKL